MYFCNECNDIFDQPQILRELHGEAFSVCPGCREGDYEDARVCRKGGAYMPESQNKFGMCSDCEEELDEKFQEFMEQFDWYEREFLNWKYDGEPF